MNSFSPYTVDTQRIIIMSVFALILAVLIFITYKKVKDPKKRSIVCALSCASILPLFSDSIKIVLIFVVTGVVIYFVYQAKE